MYEDIAIWNQDFTVTHYFVDPDGYASIHGLAFFLQEVAHNHATARSLGFNDLMKDNKAWVLTRQAIKLYRIPKLGDRIKVETWVQNTTQSFSVRDFHLMNPSGEIMGIARTSWMMLDVIQRKPVKINDEVLERIPLTPNRLKEDLPLDKLTYIQDNSQPESIKVRYSDLDMNNHVNNITYIRWVMDGFDAGFRKKNQLRSIEMNYLNEALYGDQLNSTTIFNPESKSYDTMIKRPLDNKEISITKTNWKNKT